MNKKEFSLFASALKTYYPKEKLLPNEQAMELWYQQLQDIPYKLAEVVLNKWVAIEKWSPSIADIRQQATELASGEPKDWGDGWEQVERAIRYIGLYNEDEAMKSFDDITRQVVKRLGFVNLCLSENVAADRANFRMLYDQITNRQNQNNQLPERIRNVIQSIQQNTSTGLLENKGDN